jgi:ribosomal protein S18 acetylase RimI-like enzyme
MQKNHQVMAFIPVTDYTVKKHINRDLHGCCLIWTGEADMRYNQKILLKNGKEAVIRNGDEPDGAAVFDVFNRTHGETDYLLTYPDENSFDSEQEAQFLKEKAISPNEIELVAIVDGKIAGTAGIESVGEKYKVKHRAEFGIGILKEYWGLGLGKALTKACIQCAIDAGYEQLELNVIAENERALSLYRSLGFIEYGRNPRGFNSKISGYQELVYMLLEL